MLADSSLNRCFFMCSIDKLYFPPQDGTTIETSTAAALLAATYSGGDAKIGENIAQLLVPEMGENVDQNMMAALMSSGSMIQVC